MACTAEGGAGAVGAGDSNGVIEAFSLEPGPHSVLSAVARVETDGPTRLRGRATSGDGHVVTIPTTTADTDRHALPIVGLRATTDYAIELEALDGDDRVVGSSSADIETGSLPESIPDLDVDVVAPDATAPGLTLFDLGRWRSGPDAERTDGSLVVVDPDGEVVWYWDEPSRVGDARMTDDGTILTNVTPDAIVELDMLGNTVNRWVTQPDDEEDAITLTGSRLGVATFHHEASRLPDGNLLALSSIRRPLPDRERSRLCPSSGNDRYVDDVVVEFEPDGRVVGEWAIGDVVDRLDVASTQPCNDWVHANGVIVDPDRNAVIVTARHINLLFAFRHRADESGPSGELLWSIGPDGTLPLDGEPSYGVHAPELQPDGSIVVYDNGNGRPATAPGATGTRAPFSRAVGYQINDRSEDPDDWSARQVWQHRATDRDGEPLYADFLGDADVLDNGNILIDHGGIGQRTPPASGRIVEVVPRGTKRGRIVLDIWLPDGWVSYRAERIPSLYTGPEWQAD